MDESKGRDMVKVVLGVLLIFAGNFLALKGVPDLPNLVTPAHAGVSFPGSDQAGSLMQLITDTDVNLGKYVKLLMCSLLLVNVGALLLYMSAEPKKPV